MGHDREEAQDLTQAFFAHLLARNPFTTLSPAKGKFRSFLLKSIQHFLADQNDRNSAAKRGGGLSPLPLETNVAERHYEEERGKPSVPEAIFDRRWAVTLLNRAFAALQEDFMAGDKAVQFVELSVFLAAEGNAEEYATAAGKLQMSTGAVAVAVHRMRVRYRECIRAEVAHTVLLPGEADDEMRYLLEVLCQ